MNIYKNLPDDLKNNVDKHIIYNLKEYSKNYLHPEIKEYRRKTLLNKIYDNYQDFKGRYDLFFTYELVENDILFWLNQPYSNNIDSPLIFNKTSARFKRILRRNFPYALPDINEKSYKLLTKHLSKCEIVNKYFKSLTVFELESFYRYRISQMSYHQSKYVNKISLI